MQIRSELTTVEWTEVLRLFPEASRDIYFTPEYHGLHEANKDGEALCTAVSDGGHTLLMPGLRVPIPSGFARGPVGNHFDLQSCNGYGGPIASPGASREFLEDAWNQWRACSAASGIIAAFFRLHPLVDNARCLPADATVLFDRKTAFVDLTNGLEVVWHRAYSKHRNMVSKGRREGIEVSWDGAAAWTEFEKLYAAAMDRLNAPAALRFSPAYFAHLRRLPGVELASVSTNGTLAAAAVFLNGELWCHYHLSARSEGASNHLTNCILQAAIERAAQCGLRGLHLGGGRSPSPTDSLLRFKLALGGSLLDFKVALVVADPERYKWLCRQWACEAGQLPQWLLGYRQPKPSTEPRLSESATGSATSPAQKKESDTNLTRDR